MIILQSFNDGLAMFNDMISFFNKISASQLFGFRTKKLLFFSKIKGRPVHGSDRLTSPFLFTICDLKILKIACSIHFC